MINISKDDTNVSNVNVTALKKTSPVEKGSFTQNSPQDGNNLPATTATSGSGAELQQAIDSVSLDKVVQEINEKMQLIQRELHFSVDNDSGQTVIKVIDLETQGVIRQIPNEEALLFARRLAEGADTGLFSEYT